jgi:uncharacterized membrane protein YjjB (DUF3815 family)
MILLLLEDALWSAMAAAGFACLFNVPRRALFGCMLAGAIGHATRQALLLYTPVSIEVGTLIGATLVGFFSIWMSRRLHAPSLVFAVTGTIPMAPGLFAYRAMIGFIQLTLVSPVEGEVILVEAMVNLTHTVLILGGIALGISMPHLLTRRIRPTM